MWKAGVFQLADPENATLPRPRLLLHRKKSLGPTARMSLCNSVDAPIVTQVEFFGKGAKEFILGQGKRQGKDKERGEKA